MTRTTSPTAGKANVLYAPQVFNGSVDQANPLNYRTLLGGIVAGTTQTQAGATQLLGNMNLILTCAHVGDGVALPKWEAGLSITIINKGAYAAAVWPFNETIDVDTIDGAAAAAVGVYTIPAGSQVTYHADPVTAYNWISVAGAGRKRVLDLTGVTTLTAELSGSLVTLGTAGGFTVTLPALARGLEFEFVVKVLPTTAYIVATPSSENTVQGNVLTTDVNSATDPTNTVASDTITFAANKARIGDSVKLTCDGTYWYATASTILFDGITFTQAT